MKNLYCFFFPYFLGFKTQVFVGVTETGCSAWAQVCDSTNISLATPLTLISCCSRRKANLLTMCQDKQESQKNHHTKEGVLQHTP